LIVDDIKLNRDLIANYLQDTHHQLYFAENGAEAIEMAQNILPDIILMDIRMPQVDGIQAAESLKNMTSTTSIPIVAITASVPEFNESLRQEADYLFNDLLTKPVMKDKLYGCLLKILPSLSTDNQSLENNANNNQETSELNSDNIPNLSKQQQLQLQEKLATIKTELWESLRTNLEINEIDNFIDILLGLTNDYPSPILIKYVEDLKQKSDDFEWDELTKLINKFDQICLL